jgi:hypothetical protein
MKILLLDIETAPNLAYVWGLWKQNIAINQIENAGYVLSWAAKWLGEKDIKFVSVQRRSALAMLSPIHSMLHAADAVVHYNGSSFDIPTLNKEFIINGFKPPAPYKQIDLMLAVKGEFRFPSNKLDYVANTLGLGTKVRHEGHELWTKCMKGDAEAWGRMEEYNRHDVVLLEKLYARLLPWLKKHPNHAAFREEAVCPSCGSSKVQRRGTQVATLLKYVRYHCQDCGTWFRGSKSVTVKRGGERHVPIA